jgi:hypothetical protein
MMRERIRQRAASVVWAAVLVAILAACGSTSSSRTAALGQSSSTTACSTQGGGGDNIPVPCGPTTSATGPNGLTPPATITAGSTPRFCSDPTVISVSPDAGGEAGGDLVTITGTGFGLDLTVFFGRSDSRYTLTSATVLVAISPAGPPGPAAVTVSCAGVVYRPSPAVDFTYRAVAPSPAA